MKRQVLFCHPEDHTLTWAGFGFKPDWLYAFLSHGGTEEQAAWAAVRAGYRSADSMPQGAVIPDAVTVTKKPELVQELLPGLPPVPKKRGRPSTGKAMSAAERKRQSRERMRDRQWEQLSSLSNSQLLEAMVMAIARLKTTEFPDSASWWAGKVAAEIAKRFPLVDNS